MDEGNLISSQTGRFTNPFGWLGDTWHLDELFVAVGRRRHYLCWAVDQDGNVIDILMQPRCDWCAAEGFFRRLLQGQGVDQGAL